MNKVLEVLQSAESFIENSILKANETELHFSLLDSLKVFLHENPALCTSMHKRVKNEFVAFGPIENALAEDDVTEIMINSYSEIWCETSGYLTKISDQFASKKSYARFLHRLCQEIQTQPSLEHPFASGNLGSHRVQIVGAEISAGSTAVSIRKHREESWKLEELNEKSWCTDQQLKTIESWIFERKNILIIGGTGAGKSSVLSACLERMPPNQRCVILEDSSELKVPNTSSLKLVTRRDTLNLLPEINLSKLLVESLRLRPDRLIIGEVRGPEAKDLLLALSTGHAGSWSTLHALSPQQALLRLEMLVQLGAPQWNTSSIQKLINLSIDGFIQLGKASDGARILQGLYLLSGYDEGHFLMDDVT